MSKLNYYKTRILSLMAQIEDKQCVMFQHIDPVFEKNFWDAADSKDERKLMFLHNEICKMFDDLNK